MINSDNIQKLESVIISPTITISEAIAHLDKAGTGALVLCSEGRKLYGLLTDGDIRRALLKSKPLIDPCGTIANLTPIVSMGPLPRAEALHLMDQHDINHLPVVNAKGQIESFLLRKDLLEEYELETNARNRLESVIISPTASISEAIARLDKAGTGALVLCSEGRKLYGLLTDGDIRRAVLRGVCLEDPCAAISTQGPMTIQSSISAVDTLHLMNLHDINHLPVIDTKGKVVEFRLRKDIVKEDKLDLSAVIMAGGYGKRLLPLTEEVPKPMLPVGDRPLLELTIEQLRRAGIQDVNLTTHYLPENIVKHFGDGKAFGVNLSYLNEDNPLGTAGGLRQMKRTKKPFLVINGDILTGAPFQLMLDYHRKYSAAITVGVRKYEMQVPFGVVECEDVRITRLQEKPSLTFFINAGMYLLEPSVCEYIPDGQRFDMTDLIQKLLEAGRIVVSFPIVEYWLDIGQHDDYEKAKEDILNGKI